MYNWVVKKSNSTPIVFDQEASTTYRALGNILFLRIIELLEKRPKLIAD